MITLTFTKEPFTQSVRQLDTAI